MSEWKMCCWCKVRPVAGGGAAYCGTACREAELQATLDAHDAARRLRAAPAAPASRLEAARREAVAMLVPMLVSEDSLSRVADGRETAEQRIAWMMREAPFWHSQEQRRIFDAALDALCRLRLAEREASDPTSTQEEE